MLGPRRTAVVVAAVLLGGAVAGGAALVSGGHGADPEASPRGLPLLERQPERARAERAPTVGRTSARPDPRPERPAPPTRLRIGALDLELPVAAMGVDADGLMALPTTPFATAWYRYGADPTDRQGAVVVAGHVDTAEEGVGPLARLGGLAAGSRVTLDHRGGSTTYEVVAVRRLPKAVLDLPALFRRTGPPRLHLVTCGGPYLPDQGGYQDNVVVVAEPT
ncbi:class F sortase [Nocardioides euryhalodurans]|uniref:Class F sortase n=1 Tax=Nocardioides euryhalodurans TaxID=2518370 RepID=A0A4P7GKW8_9ACTN|nr:class F sortase [Nocardioides euryhalodurans]QBR92449.1 class F sortase [Nocardioides euryhalodurans]